MHGLFSLLRPLCLIPIEQRYWQRGLKRHRILCRKENIWEDQILFPENISGIRAAFSHLDGAAYQMIQVMSHSSGLLKEKEEYENEEGAIDMCQALLDMREECISIGEEKGISIGKQLTKQVFQLWMAGKTEKEIAEICEVSVEEVKDILS